MADVSKNWAQEYILDPLNEPEPASVTGLNTSFRAKPDSPTHRLKSQGTGSTSASSSNPFRNGTSASRRTSQSHAQAVVNDTDAFPSYRSEALASSVAGSSRRSSSRPTSSSPKTASRPRRSSSLRERYPGDTSVHMLDQIRKEQKAAYRSPHLHKRHISGPDTIDKLDAVPGAQYHHEGPYDAASLARNHSFNNSPIAALQNTNDEAIKATPYDKVKDSLNGHRPLDGVAQYPPGTTDQLGQSYHYEEGTDMMREANPAGGAYKRWPGVDYLPDDLKGKGEPSYSMDKLMREHKLSGRDKQAFELVDRPKSKSAERERKFSRSHGDDDDGTRSRSGSGAKRISGELKRRIGSLKKKDIWI